MKKIETIFQEKLESVLQLTSERKFSNCKSIITDLLQTSWTLELPDEVFICEVLEAIFIEALEPTQTYDMPEEDMKKMVETMHANMKNIISSYTKKDITGLYNSLKELRNVVTNYQLFARQNYNRKITIPSSLGLGRVT